MRALLVARDIGIVLVLFLRTLRVAPVGSSAADAELRKEPQADAEIGAEDDDDQCNILDNLHSDSFAIRLGKGRGST